MRARRWRVAWLVLGPVAGDVVAWDPMGGRALAWRATWRPGQPVRLHPIPADASKRTRAFLARFSVAAGEGGKDDRAAEAAVRRRIAAALAGGELGRRDTPLSSLRRNNSTRPVSTSVPGE